MKYAANFKGSRAFMDRLKKRKRAFAKILNKALLLLPRGHRLSGGDAACEVVRDLIPLYADGAASERTQKFVDAHLAVCKDCADYYRSVKAGWRENRISRNTGRLGVGGFANVAGRIRRRRAVYSSVAAAALLLSLCFNLYTILYREN